MPITYASWSVQHKYFCTRKANTCYFKKFKIKTRQCFLMCFYLGFYLAKMVLIVSIPISMMVVFSQRLKFEGVAPSPSLSLLRSCHVMKWCINATWLAIPIRIAMLFFWLICSWLACILLPKHLGFVWKIFGYSEQ